jgi:hypothetical protein
MLFPDYFTDRAKKWRDLAKRMRNPELAQTFADRARFLTQTAMEAGRSLGRINGANKLSPPVVVSQAKTLAELRSELQNLSDRTRLCVPLRDHAPDRRGEFWRASPHLSRQFECSAEFRPDGCLWFIKHG